MGTGLDFGNVLVWSSAANPCRLRGTVGFAAYYGNGARDPDASAMRRLVVAATMPPRTSTPSVRPAFGNGEQLYLDINLAGEYRDDPSAPDGSCSAANEDRPARLVVTVGTYVFDVMNDDATARGLTGLEGCHGFAGLEGVAEPSG